MKEAQYKREINLYKISEKERSLKKASGKEEISRKLSRSGKEEISRKPKYDRALKRGPKTKVGLWA